MRELSANGPRLLSGEDMGEGTAPYLGWRVDLIYLRGGPIRRSGVVVPIGAASVALFHVEGAMVLRSAFTKSHFAMLVTSPGSPLARICSRPIGTPVSLMLGSRASAEVYLPDRCSAFVLSAPATSVIAATHPGALSALPANGRAELRALAADHVALLNASIDLMETLYRSASLEVAAPVVRNRLDELLAPIVADLFSVSRILPAEPANEALRHRAVTRACGHIYDNLRRHITLEDLCRSAGVSARTLEYGFREFYDVGPMAYLRSVRLSRVRRALRSARRTGVSVTKVARRWHFTHLGQFSRNYRLLFGESPSETLARSRPAAASAANLSMPRS